MNVVLISTYELGRQPFGLASPAAWLREAGSDVVCLDLSRSALQEGPIRSADLVAFYIPMHTATRIAALLIGRVRELNPRAHLCFFGLYAPVNETYLRELGAGTILGGEFEEGLLALVKRLQASALGQAISPQSEPLISTARQKFLTPDRVGLPALDHYARLELGNGERGIVGYTEASRGCKHLCLHCPIVPVYQGHFRIVQREVVLEDIRQQVEMGASHITFGDPDFFNGLGHSLSVVETLHQNYPRLTYDVTIKIEHLLKYSRHLKTLRDTGCILVTSAAESLDDNVLRILDKGHTRADFVRVVELFREMEVNLSPTFVTFSPWTSIEGYLELLSFLAEMDLTESVSPIQLAIRLLIPAGSMLLEVPEVRSLMGTSIGEFNRQALSYQWKHNDPRVENLYEEVRRIVSGASASQKSRTEVFQQVYSLAEQVADGSHGLSWPLEPLPSRATLPYINEPWFC